MFLLELTLTLYMDLPLLSAILLPKPLSVSSSPSWYSIQDSIWLRDSFYRQWNMVISSCNEDPVGHSHHWSSRWWEREIGSKLASWTLVCLHKFICSCSFQFIFDDNPSFSYIPSYPHEFQFVPALPTPCSSFFPGCRPWWLHAQHQMQKQQPYIDCLMRSYNSILSNSCNKSLILYHSWWFCFFDQILTDIWKLCELPIQVPMFLMY